MAEPSQSPPGEAGQSDQSDQKPSALVERLQERRARHHEHGRVYRGAFIVGGFIVTGAGIAMLALPGPALVVIPVGLALLALEFSWAERLLARAVRYAENARRKASQASRTQRIASTLATAVGVAGAVAVAILYDIPYLPV